MTLSIGDRIPNVTLMTTTGEGSTPVGSGEALGSGTVVLIAVPGAFTPTCSNDHLPGYVQRADELRAKGVDTVACIAVNDAFGLGTRSQRYAAILEDGVVRQLMVEPNPLAVTVSSVDAVLDAL